LTTSLTTSISSLTKRTAPAAPARFLTIPLLLACLAVAGCSSFSDLLTGDKVDYKSSGKAPSLDVPPDLTQLSRETRYVVPGVAVSASAFEIGQSAPALPTAATSVGDVRIERSGNQRWLVVNRPAEKLWEPVRDFWQESGFLLAIEQQNLGILETDYAENRAKLPQDFIRNTIGKLIESVYSTGERDKFRTRLERTPSGATEIFISHRGMVETVVSGGGANSSGQTLWEPRPADPELEAEFLRRLMVKLGVTQDQAQAAIASAGTRQTSRVARVDNVPVVQIDEGFDRAWRRVGLALDRTGFTVEDRDRAKGLYFVRYVEPTADMKEPGFFGKLMGRAAPAKAPLQYRISVRGQGEATTVSVLNAQGVAESSANAQRIVQVIADDLR
jgi:outer membrane protein assembly factor BamC